MKFTGKLVQETKVLNTQAVRQGALLGLGLHTPAKGKRRIFFREVSRGEGDVDETSDLRTNSSGVGQVHTHYQRMMTANQPLFPKKMHLSHMKGW